MSQSFYPTCFVPFKQFSNLGIKSWKMIFLLQPPQIYPDKRGLKEMPILQLWFSGQYIDKLYDYIFPKALIKQTNRVARWLSWKEQELSATRMPIQFPHAMVGCTPCN